jgi:tetratricopeptide (TPR) repeat protein
MADDEYGAASESGEREIPDTDVDGPAAKAHGDYFYDVDDFARATDYYQEALNKGDLDAATLEKVHYNMASCYQKLGDQGNCYTHAYEAAKSQVNNISWGALTFFYWAVTGETVPTMPVK